MQSNYERKAHPEGRQKSAPFSVSQLSPPPHHVFPKPGPVPGAKCTGKRVLGPAVIWAWRAGRGWIRNQLIGPETMRPLVGLPRAAGSASTPPPASLQQSTMPGGLLRRALPGPFAPTPCWTAAIFCFEWHPPCVVRGADEQQATAWYWYFFTSCYGTAAAAASGTTAPLESRGLETSREASPHQPGTAQISPRKQILSGLTALLMFCRLCAFMILSKHYGNQAVAPSQSPPIFPASLTASSAATVPRSSCCRKGVSGGTRLPLLPGKLLRGTERCPEGEGAVVNTDLRQFTKDCREI